MHAIFDTPEGLFVFTMVALSMLVACLRVIGEEVHWGEQVHKIKVDAEHLRIEYGQRLADLRRRQEATAKRSTARSQTRFKRLEDHAEAEAERTNREYAEIEARELQREAEIKAAQQAEAA